MALAVVVVLFLDLGVHSAGNAHHPKELVDVVRRVAHAATKDNEDIVHIVLAHHLERAFLVSGHGQTNCRDVSVVARIVVHNDGSVAHTRDLVAIVPPGHDARVLGCVVSQPRVRLAEVVEDNALAAVSRGHDDDRGGGVGGGSHPRAVDGEEVKEHKEERHDDERDDLGHARLASSTHVVILHRRVRRRGR